MDKEILIRSLAYGGEGVADINGKVCFIDGALPGERMTIRITQEKKNFSRGIIEKMIEPSSERVEAPCPHYTKCGGCQYQHSAYETELRGKENQVREYLERMIGLPGDRVKPIVPSSESYGYRNHVTLHYIRPKKSDETIVGFVGRDNKTVIPVKECLLAAKELGAVFNGPSPKSTSPRYERTFRLSGDKQIMTSGSKKLFTINVGDQAVWAHTDGFFQNNLEITARIGTQIKAWLTENKSQTFFDLYAGAGTFVLLSAQSIPKIICIESNPACIEALEKNLTPLEADCQLIEGTVEDNLGPWLEKYPPAGPVTMFLDPPRKGMDAGVPKLLQTKPADQLIYLSCHLGTLARDLKTIAGGGGYEVLEVIPFDMFPRTKHIEILARLG